MAVMTEHMFLLLNAGCLLFLLTFLLSFALSLAPLILALAVMLVNIYHILRAACAPAARSSRLLRGEGRGELGEFEQRVREAYDQSMRRAESRRGEDYFWSRSQARQSEAIEELRKVPLAEEFKGSLSRREPVEHREEGSSAKKVRSFFQAREEGLDEATRAQVGEAVARAVGARGEEVRARVGGCVRTVNEFIGGRLEGEVEAVIEDFEAASRFLSRCFSLALTLQRPSDLALSPAQLLELVRIIDQKQMLPSRFASPLSFVEIVAELACVRDRIARLPNFSLGAGVLRMVLALKHLRKEFPEESIALADFSREEGKQGETHVIRMQDNGRFYYNREPQVKSDQPAVVLLLLAAHLLKKYHRSSHLARSLQAELDGKYYA